MAFRAANCVKSMVGRLKGTGTSTFTTSTTPKMKAYTPAADPGHVYNQDTKLQPVKGQFVPVYVALGMITLSLSLGGFTVVHQLSHAPNVHLKKSRRETLPELVEPEKVVEDADRFLKKSFFRKVAHVQEYDRRDVMSDPIRGDVYARKPHAETLKSVGVDPSSFAHEAKR